MTSRRTALLLAPLVASASALATAPSVAAPVATAGPAALVTESRVIGASVQGRPIVAVHRFHPGATRTVLVIGSIHGDERAGLRVVHRLRHRELPASVGLWTIRSVYPDGSAADRRTNAHGVDLNRNFPRHWVRHGRGTATWSGPSRASEPETRALTAFLRWLQPRTTIVLHQPLEGVDSYHAKSMRLVRRLADEMRLPVKRFACSGVCHGTLTDWANARTPGRAVTVELARPAPTAQVKRAAGAVVRVVRGG